MSEAQDARRRTRVVVYFIVALVLAALGDSTVADLVASEPRGLFHAGVVVSRFGLSGYMLVLSALIVLAATLARRRGRPRLFGVSSRLLTERAAYVFVTIAWSGILCQVVKHIIGRARPKFFGLVGAYHFDPVTWRPGIDGFPSGHSTTVFALAVMFSLFLPSGRLVFFALALLVAIARILAGAHYPSDVVAGAAFGSIVALWMARVFAARNIAFAATTLPSLTLKRDAGAMATMPGAVS